MKSKTDLPGTQAQLKMEVSYETKLGIMNAEFSRVLFPLTGKPSPSTLKVSKGFL